jgi:hypothetical protein
MASAKVMNILAPKKKGRKAICHKGDGCVGCGERGADIFLSISNQLSLYISYTGGD